MKSRTFVVKISYSRRRQDRQYAWRNSCKEALMSPLYKMYRVDQIAWRRKFRIAGKKIFQLLLQEGGRSGGWGERLHRPKFTIPASSQVSPKPDRRTNDGLITRRALPEMTREECFKWLNTTSIATWGDPFSSGGKCVKIDLLGKLILS